MKDGTHAEIQEIDKERLIDVLTEELPVLRAKIGLSQDDLSSIIGISRQTYSSIETKKRRMSWNTYLSMILVFESNEKTRGLLDTIGAFPIELRKLLNIDRRPAE
jgi:DNA-binding XRE family transcriptional regulator